MIPSVYPEDLRQTGHPNRRLMTVTSSNPQAQRYPGPCISSLSKKKIYLIIYTATTTVIHYPYQKKLVMSYRGSSQTVPFLVGFSILLTAVYRIRLL